MEKLKPSQRCANCDYYATKYRECEHPDQTQSEAGRKTPNDGVNCELWAYGGEPEEDIHE